MSNGTARTLLMMAATLALSGMLCVENIRAQQGAGQNVPAHDKTPAGPAPAKDVSGVWMGGPLPRLNNPPAMTAEGQAAFKLNKSFQGRNPVPVSESNDPMLHCDPLGFPRAVLFETRGIKFVQLPKETLQLFQYQRTWREIWTDGRELPKGIGGDAIDAPDPRYYGYSIGHWDGDYTFVVTLLASMKSPGWMNSAIRRAPAIRLSQ